MSQFAQDTAVTQIAENRWRGEFVKGVRIGPVVNGGYVLATVGRAIREALPHNDPVALNGFYLAPCALGPVEIEVEALRQGRGTSFASASLFQDGELKVRATAAYSNADSLDGEDWLPAEPPEAPPFDAAYLVSATHLEIHDRIDMRLTQGIEVFQEVAANGLGEFVGWVQHQDRAPCDTLDLIMIADILPPPPFSVLGPFGWVPTIELTVQCRAKPAPGPILTRLKGRHMTRGIMECDADLWDSQGQLVALARQTMKVRLPSDWQVKQLS